MNAATASPRSPEPIEQEAARWVLRRDRGLTPTEQDELSRWLAADPRHGPALAEHGWGWAELDRLTGLQASLGARPDPDLLAPPPGAGVRIRRRLVWLVPVTLAVAAALVLALRPRGPAGGAAATLAAPTSALLSVASAERRVLEEGSIVEVAAESGITVQFTAAERGVRLLRGAATFTVARDPWRPFVVRAGDVEIRAIGTIFDVRLDAVAVEVLVIEGVVAVEHAPAASPPAGRVLLEAGQRAVIPRESATPVQVTTLSSAQVSRPQPLPVPLLRFDSVPLAEVVATFNRHSQVQLVIGDPTIAGLRVSGVFRSGDAESFVRLLRAALEVSAVRRGDEIVLFRSLEQLR